MLGAGLAVAGVGGLLVQEGRDLAGVAAWSRRFFGVVLLLVGLGIVVGMVGAVVDPF